MARCHYCRTREAIPAGLRAGAAAWAPPDVLTPRSCRLVTAALLPDGTGGSGVARP